jgi:hypothetical protein
MEGRIPYELGPYQLPGHLPDNDEQHLLGPYSVWRRYGLPGRRVGHGSTRGYQNTNPYLYPHNPYPVRVGSKTRTGLPAGGELPAGLQIHVRVTHYLGVEIVSYNSKLAQKRFLDRRHTLNEALHPAL